MRPRATPGLLAGPGSFLTSGGQAALAHPEYSSSAARARVWPVAGLPVLVVHPPTPSDPEPEAWAPPRPPARLRPAGPLRSRPRPPAVPTRPSLFPRRRLEVRAPAGGGAGPAARHVAAAPGAHPAPVGQQRALLRRRRAGPRAPGRQRRRGRCGRGRGGRRRRARAPRR